MSLQSDLKTLLSPIASGKFYAQAAPADADEPFIVYRILNKDPLQTLSGSTGHVRYSVAFECYALSYNDALTMAEAVKAAIEGSSLVSFEESAPGEEYIVDVDGFMEPVFYGFWH